MRQRTIFNPLKIPKNKSICNNCEFKQNPSSLINKLDKNTHLICPVLSDMDKKVYVLCPPAFWNFIEKD